VSVILLELTYANSLLSTSFLCKTCVMLGIPLMKINAKWHALCSWVRDETLAPGSNVIEGSGSSVLCWRHEHHSSHPS